MHFLKRMWLNGLFITYCSLISLRIYRGEIWSGHVCTRSLVTYFTERYCARYDWWTVASDCKVWETRQSSNVSYEQYCCSGWKHNGNKICNILTDVISTSTNASTIETARHADNRGEINAEKSIVKRQANICGGHLIAQTTAATLTSPNYPNPYTNNLRCNWTIVAPANYVIVIRITYLELEENAYCSFDYLSISLDRNKTLETGPICTNKTKDLSFLTRSNESHFTFVTDGSVTRRGFSVQYKAAYICAMGCKEFTPLQCTVSDRQVYLPNTMKTSLNCGKHLTAQTSITTLTSPLYPSKYENNLNCHWTIESPVNSTIVIQIRFIELEETTDCSLDFIQIYLGEKSIFATDRICRNNTKEVNYISRSNEADVIFVTDSSVVKTGFSLQLYAVNKCGGRLAASNTSATLTSPYYPRQYDNNLRCHWTIEGLKYSRIAIQIVFIDLEENSDCSYDYLQIYIGERNIFETGRICRHSPKDLNFITRLNKADVIFITDGSIKKTGFSLNYKTVSTCGEYQNVETATVNLTSPQHPSVYANNLYCLWTIRGPIHSRIALNITYIDIEKGFDDCRFDFLQIYLGYHYIVKTNRICGNITKGLIFISGSNEIDIVFSTDGSVQNTGFVLQYHAVSICGGPLSASTATASLVSPNYPSQYSNYLRCHWSIKAPLDYRINIIITDIDLQETSDCSFDYLQLYLGNNYVLDPSRICRRNNVSLNTISMSDEVHVIFITDRLVTRRGFSLQYKAVIDCGGNLTAMVSTAKLTAPHSSFRYDDNLRCHWSLYAPISNRIFIHIDFDYNKECSSEYLQLYLGTNYTFQTDKMCNNNIQNMNFITMSNRADVIFATNGTRTKTFFSLQYQAVKYCEGHLMAQTAMSTLSSPNYPFYQNSLYCHWTIGAPVNYRIVINITNIEFEEYSDCSRDYLQIYLDANDSVKTHRMCRNNTEDMDFITISNQTDIIFVTTGNMTKSRFVLQYKAVYICGGNLKAHATSETLTSPNYASPYGNNLQCNWIIEAPVNLKIAIHVTNIDLEDDGRCLYDYLQLNLGTNNTAMTVRICTNNTKYVNFVTNSHQAEIVFVTDANRARKGFSLQYKAVAYCEEHLMAQTAMSTLSSPNYPFYQNNLYCHWTIGAPVNYRIVINITNIEFEEYSDCSRDYLQIYLDANDSVKTHRMCRNNTEDMDFITISNQTDIIFVTTGHLTKSRFVLQYKAVYICGGHLKAHATSETLTSPNYPSPYGNNLQCNWIIEAPVNLTIAIHVTNIDLEDDGRCLYDYLQLNLGTNNTAMTVRICTNNTKYLNFVTNSHQAEIDFVTDGNKARKGFSLQYQAGTCYCDVGSGHAYCNSDLNQKHLKGLLNLNGHCIKIPDGNPRPEKAGQERLDVNIVIASVVSLVAAMVIALGLWCYCRKRRTRRDNDKREERPYIDLQPMKKAETEENIYFVNLSSNSSKTSESLQGTSNIYDNLM